jgi:hypothetical protein
MHFLLTAKSFRLLSVVPLLLGNAALADSLTLRCGSKLIEVGDTADAVRKTCGEPDSIERDTKTFRNGGRLGGVCFHGTVPIERWTYDRGSTRFTAILVVADGKLVRISFAGVDRQPEIWSLGCRF